MVSTLATSSLLMISVIDGSLGFHSARFTLYQAVGWAKVRSAVHARAADAWATARRPLPILRTLCSCCFAWPTLVIVLLQRRRRMPATFRRFLLASLLAPLVLQCGAAFALDQIRFGKAVPNSFAFGAAEVGIQAKIYEQEGIDLQVLSFAGDARIQQALTADGIDVAVGSGPGLGFRAKGVPAICVAAMYGPPTNLCLTVPVNSAIKTAADLKGRHIGVTTAGSLTDWLTRELSRQQGWGSEGIKVDALGAVQAQLGAQPGRGVAG